MTTDLGKCPMCGGDGPSPCCVGEFMMLSVPFQKVRGISIYRIPPRISIARTKALRADQHIRGLVMPSDDLLDASGEEVNE